MKKSLTTRTTIGDIATIGPEIPTHKLAMVVGGMQCGGNTPHPTSTATMNTDGDPDSMTDCTN